MISPQAGELPTWMLEGVFWLAVGALLALLATAIGVWTLVSRMRELREEEKRLSILGEIESKVGRLLAAREDLEVRRLEHLLIDVRDVLRRLEQRLLASQAPALPAAATGDLLVPAPSPGLAERVTNRLLAQGYAEVQILLGVDAMADLGQRDGEVPIEARRQGVLFKGRVLVRSGRIEAVEMNPAYSVFP